MREDTAVQPEDNKKQHIDSINVLLERLAEAFSRIEYDIKLLHENQDKWILDPLDGMYIFDGYIDPFIVKKRSIDLIREVWHIYDGTIQIINTKWRAGMIKVTDTNLDKGKGPGKSVVDKYVKENADIQLCGDIANLTKHYKLERATKSGNGEPVIGSSMFVSHLTGEIELGKDESGKRYIKVAKPTTFRPTLVVEDEDGKQLGDIVDIALKARDAWIILLKRCGFEFNSVAQIPKVDMADLC
ncbi:MAG: hypothetical protein QM811_08670 [Pirellulales bacterium]